MKTAYDVIVAGGGFAGYCAALAAARQGAKVLLIERWNCLGGAAMNGLVNPFMGYWTKMPDTGETKQLANGIFGEIIDAIRENKAHDPGHFYSFDEEFLKLYFNRTILSAGVTLLFHAVVSSAEVTDGKIRSVTCATKSGPMTFTAHTFIDATGDAELSMLSGCPFSLGREEDGLCQPMTLCFRMGNIDKEKYHAHFYEINALYQKMREEGRFRNPRENLLVFPNINEGVLHFNSTRVVKMNPTDPWDVTAAEIEAREQVYEIRDFLRAHAPGFENCRVLSTAMQIGARESRRIDGEYTLTVEDLKNLTRFPDAIAVCNYDIDIHNPAGTGTSHYYFGDGEWYTIPYRCLIPKGVTNMLVAGRCISTTHEAQASYRIMPYVANIGEAAGVAAAMAASGDAPVRNIDVSALQEILRKGGAVI